ncbi:hypothetical protein [Litoribacillus peritrichatus]|uniref:Uncharacterized protein n=1 Tax=Litoribacillus peritrichatus TaxID=718191 RepID=A0ABP7MVF9_9GAMM
MKYPDAYKFIIETTHGYSSAKGGWGFSCRKDTLEDAIRFVDKMGDQYRVFDNRHQKVVYPKIHEDVV